MNLFFKFYFFVSILFLSSSFQLTESDESRYFLASYDLQYSNGNSGSGSYLFNTNKGHFKRYELKTAIKKSVKSDVSYIVISNIHEFDNEKDYLIFKEQ